MQVVGDGMLRCLEQRYQGEESGYFEQRRQHATVQLPTERGKLWRAKEMLLRFAVHGAVRHDTQMLV